MEEARQTVTVYRLKLSDLARRSEAIYPTLTKADRDSCDRYKFREDYLRRLGSAYLMRRYVGEGIRRDENGKPYKEGTHFNVSHSGEYVVLAKANVPVGVDIEVVGEEKTDVFAYVASKREQREDFFLVWTQKESLLKCEGSGIGKDLKSVPALPVGQKRYGEKDYFSYATAFDGHALSVTVEGKYTALDVIFSDVTP